MAQVFRSAVPTYCRKPYQILHQVLAVYCGEPNMKFKED